MQNTREFIIETVLQTLEEMPYSKISVKEIVSRCGINRNTFYYYFNGLPDLIETAARELFSQTLDAHFSYDSPMEFLTPLVEYCMAYKKALLHIYHSASREAVLLSMSKLNGDLAERYVEKVIAETSLHLNERDRIILCRFYKCALTGVMLDWLDAKMSYDLLSAAERLCDLLAGSSRRAFLKGAESSE